MRFVMWRRISWVLIFMFGNFIPHLVVIRDIFSWSSSVSSPNPVFADGLKLGMKSMFVGFEPEQAFDKLKSTQFRVNVVKRLHIIEDLCVQLRNDLSCVKGESYDLIADSSHGISFDREFAFGVYSVNVVVSIPQTYNIRSNCFPRENWKVDNCVNGMPRGRRAKFLLVKYPATTVAWTVSHLLSRYVWTVRRSKKPLTPFPLVVELPEDVKRKVTNEILVSQMFDGTVRYADLPKKLDEMNFDRNVSKFIMFRVNYIFTLWGILLKQLAIHHGDFHGGNMLVDIRGVNVQKSAERNLKALTMNSLKIIDLDTASLPGIQQEKRIPGSGQVIRPDSFLIYMLTSRNLNRLLPSEDVARKYREQTKPTMCITKDSNCSTELQALTIKFVCQFLQHNMNSIAAANLNVLWGLPKCSDVQKSFLKPDINKVWAVRGRRGRR
uniref:Uncharacterized protein n=2 Tax=Lankesteria abbotti TaxID=340204 RepID=A0A7S2QQK7_9APIC|mmetsp:Transcript_1336/g.1514  ORF Transcript_1336/g.1514 Transcript_1336/m.1514 type:complete len:438 (+) Transcript_1336:64-1377(+)